LRRANIFFQRNSKLRPNLFRKENQRLLNKVPFRRIQQKPSKLALGLTEQKQTLLPNDNLLIAWRLPSLLLPCKHERFRAHIHSRLFRTRKAFLCFKASKSFLNERTRDATLQAAKPSKTKRHSVHDFRGRTERRLHKPLIRRLPHNKRKSEFAEHQGRVKFYFEILRNFAEKLSVY